MKKNITEPTLMKLKNKHKSQPSGDRYVLFYSNNVGMVVKDTITSDPHQVGSVHTNWSVNCFKRV